MSGFFGRGGSVILAQSAAPVSHTGDTAEATLASVTIPAGSIGANGQIEVITLWSTTNSANTKTLRVKLGATAFMAAAATTTLTEQTYTRIANRGAANSQVGYNSANISGFGSTTGAATTGAIDTTADVTLAITGQLALATETLTLESYIVKLYPKG